MKNLITAARILIIVGVFSHVLMFFMGMVSVFSLAVHVALAIAVALGVACGFIALVRSRRRVDLSEEDRAKLRLLKWPLVTGLMYIVFLAVIVTVGLLSLQKFEEDIAEQYNSPEFCSMSVVDPTQPLPRDAAARKVWLESVCTIPVTVEKISDPEHCNVVVENIEAPLSIEDESYRDWLINTSGCDKVDIVARSPDKAQ